MEVTHFVPLFLIQNKFDFDMWFTLLNRVKHSVILMNVLVWKLTKNGLIPFIQNEFQQYLEEYKWLYTLDDLTYLNS